MTLKNIDMAIKKKVEAGTVKLKTEKQTDQLVRQGVYSIKNRNHLI